MRRVGIFILLTLKLSCTGWGDFWDRRPKTQASPKAITSFSLPALALTGNIKQSVITLFAEATNTVSPQAAVFTTTGKKVLVGGVEQVSGVTLNDFTSPVTYTVVAEDGTTFEYLVMVLAPRLVPGLSAWYKADAQSYGDGVTMTTWTDSSGNGNNLDTSLGGGLPFFKVGIINGKPVGRFATGSFSGIQRTSLSGFSGNSVTTFIVFRRTAYTGQEQYFYNLGPGSCNGLTQSLQATFGPILAQIPCGPYFVNAVPDFSDTASFHLLVFRYDYSTNNSTQYLDGAVQFAGAVSGGPYTLPTPSKLIVGNFDSGTRGLDADLAEFLYFSGALSDTEVRRLSCYLSEKYALPVASACP